MTDRTAQTWLDPEEAAAMLGEGVSIRTLSRWRVACTGPNWKKIDGRVIYHRLDVADYLRRQADRVSA